MRESPYVCRRNNSACGAVYIAIQNSSSVQSNSAIVTANMKVLLIACLVGVAVAIPREQTNLNTTATNIFESHFLWVLLGIFQL